MVVKHEVEMTDSLSEERSWADLPIEILDLITHHFVLQDRFNFAHVCKSWFSVVYNGLPYGAPCHVSINNDGKECTLADPLCNELRIKCTNLPSKCDIVSSKDGWLLVYGHENSIFFFNPLSTTRIDLPDLNFCHHVYTFAFSLPPTSPDCLIFAYQSYGDDATKIFLCQRGMKEWTALGETENEFSFISSYVGSVFYQGSFYCMSDDGRLAIFDIQKNVWSLMLNPEPDENLENSTIGELYMTVSDEDLLMIYVDKFGDLVQICKLDPLCSHWKIINDLGDTSVFVGRKSSMCSKTGALIGNSIYFSRIKAGEYMRYSCGERTFHPSGNFFGSEVPGLGFWIDPLWSKHSPEELKWSN